MTRGAFAAQETLRAPSAGPAPLGCLKFAGSSPFLKNKFLRFLAQTSVVSRWTLSKAGVFVYLSSVLLRDQGPETSTALHVHDEHTPGHSTSFLGCRTSVWLPVALPAWAGLSHTSPRQTGPWPGPHAPVP